MPVVHPENGAAGTGEAVKSQPAKHLVTRAAWTGEGHKTQAHSSLRLCGVPKNLNLNGLDLGSAGPASDSSQQSKLEPEKCRLGKHTRHEQGQT